REPRTRGIVYRSGKLPPNVPPWFKEYDTDNDAQVALYEWKDKNRTVEDFQKYDLNGDGFITIEELIRSRAMVVGNKTNASVSENPSNGFGRSSLNPRGDNGSRRGQGMRRRGLGDTVPGGE